MNFRGTGSITTQSPLTIDGRGEAAVVLLCGPLLIKVANPGPQDAVANEIARQP